MVAQVHSSTKRAAHRQESLEGCRDKASSFSWSRGSPSNPRWAMLSTLSASVSTYFSKSTAPISTPEEDEASRHGERENAQAIAPRTLSLPRWSCPLASDSRPC